MQQGACKNAAGRRCVALCSALLLAGPAWAQGRAAQGDLQTVVVSATRHAMALVDAPAAMAVVTQQQLADRGADNLFECIAEAAV